MIAVLDTSAAIEIILKKDKAIKFNNEIANIKWIIAPDLFVSELTMFYGSIRKQNYLHMKNASNMLKMDRILLMLKIYGRNH